MYCMTCPRPCFVENRYIGVLVLWNDILYLQRRCIVPCQCPFNARTFVKWGNGNNYLFHGSIHTYVCINAKINVCYFCRCWRRISSNVVSSNKIVKFLINLLFFHKTDKQDKRLSLSQVLMFLFVVVEHPSQFTFELSQFQM